MTADDPRPSTRIRDLNDAFRRTFVGGTVVITAGVEALPSDQRRSILAKVRAFDAFTEDNDPHERARLRRRRARRRPLLLEDRLLRPRDGDAVSRSRRPVRHDARPDDHARRRILSVWRSLGSSAPPPAAACRQITPQPDRSNGAPPRPRRRSPLTINNLRRLPHARQTSQSRHPADAEEDAAPRRALPVPRPRSRHDGRN